MEVESLTEPRVVKNIILSFLFFLWIAWIWARRNLYRFTLKFPGGLGQLAFGTIIEIQNLHNIDEAITNYFQRFKQYTICLWLGFYPMLVTAEPELVEKILTSPDLLNKSPPMYSPVDTVSRGGLLSSPVSKWRRNRKLIVPSFSHNVLMSFLPIFHNTKVSLLSKLEDMVGKGEHSLSEVIARATLTASIRYCSLWRVHKLSFNCPHIQWYFGLYIANLEQDRKSLKQKVGQYKMNDSTSNGRTKL